MGELFVAIHWMFYGITLLLCYGIVIKRDSFSATNFVVVLVHINISEVVIDISPDLTKYIVLWSIFCIKLCIFRC